MRRRQFLQVSAALGGGLLISFTSSDASDRRGTTPGDDPERFVINDLLQIGSDNSIHVISSKVEMGQGIWTTLPILVAEELDCDWKAIRVEQRPSGRGKDLKESLYALSTGGSDSTRSEFDRYRMAGATARTLLITTAAKQLNVNIADCRTADGFVIAGDRKLSFGELAAAASGLPVPSVELRRPEQWRHIGKTHGRVDLASKVNGQAQYGIDIQFPGLLTAVVAHPTVFGAKVKSWRATKTKAITGVVDVVEIPEGVAVLATSFWPAKRGRDLLEVEWDTDNTSPVSSSALANEYNHLMQEPGRIAKQSGNVVEALSGSSRTIDAGFVLPYLAHSPMETLNCTVRIDGDRCEIWSGTQNPIVRQMEVARALDIPAEHVTFHTPLLGGGFGRRGTFSGDWIMEAVHIAKASGRFIKLVWTREDDVKGGYYRPMYVHRANISLDEKGYPEAWHHHIVGQSLFENTPLANDIVVDGIDYSSIGGVFGSAYFDSIPHHQIELHTARVNVPVIPWRSVGHTHTAFVMETLIDELAHAAHIDPVTYRRNLLKDHPRLLSTLDLAVEKADWFSPAPSGVFRGIALHPAMNSYVCQIVELSMVQSRPKIHRVICAIDCGIAVNPGGIVAQMESGIIYGLTAALYGAIDIEGGTVKQNNFNDYRMLRINETPAIEVHIVPGGKDVGGVGEPGVPPIAPALGNAIFAATGKRIRQLPLSITWS